MCFNTDIRCIADYIKISAKSKECDRDWLKARRLENVKNKIKFGRKLSCDEKVFLKIHALDLYEKTMKIEEERDEFRRVLANCKTKQEAMLVRTSKSMELRMETKSKDNLEYVTMRMMAMLDEFSDFAKSKP
jgi:hypothetical protein